MDDVLEQLVERMRAAKLRWPSLRLGQLLGNTLVETQDLYYISDEQLLKNLVFYMENN